MAINLARGHFCLDTTESSATKYTPYYVVFGRKPVMLQDLLLSHTTASTDQDAQSASEYTAELKAHLAEVYKHVAIQLNLTRQKSRNNTTKTFVFIVITPGRKYGCVPSILRPEKKRSYPHAGMDLGL